jgi:C4-dicarboxylate transporter DctQ subunit
VAASAPGIYGETVSQTRDPIQSGAPVGPLRLTGLGLILSGLLVWLPLLAALFGRPGAADETAKLYWWFLGWGAALVGLGIAQVMSFNPRRFNAAWLAAVAGLFGVVAPLLMLLAGRLGIFGDLSIKILFRWGFWWIAACFLAAGLLIYFTRKTANRLDPEPTHLWGRTIRAFNVFEESSVVWVLLILSLIKFVDVIGRKFFGESFAWFGEVAHLGVVYMVFLGASLGIKYGVHFTMDLAVNNLPGRSAEAVQALMNLMSAVLFAIVAWSAVKYGFQVMGWGNQTPIFKINKGWGYFLLGFLSLNITIRFFMVTWRHLAAIIRITREEAAGDARV